MTEPEPPRTGGAHRRDSSKSRLSVLLASLAGIAIAAGLVILALHLRGEPADNPSTATSPTATPQTSLHSPSPSSSPPSVSVSTSQTTTSPPVSATATTPSPTSVSPTSTTAGPPPAVDVLNDSRVIGLAASAAKKLRGNGWQVATVGNWHGSIDVPSTTVFYPAADKAAAQRLASQYGISRVLPASSGLSSSNLTLVLAYDWSGAG
jgi:cytoskeletal protein RodZ